MFSNVKNRARSFLLWTQEYTGTDNIYIAKHGFWSTLGFAINSVLGFATVLAFANLLPKEVYGTYKYLISIMGTLGFLALSGINTAIAQAVSRGQDRAMIYAVRIQLRWNLMFMVVGLGISGYYFIKGNIVFGAALAILSMMTPITAALNSYGPYLTGKKEFKRSAFYSVISGIASSIIMLVAITVTKNIIALIAANALSSLLPVIVFYLLIERKVRGPELTPQEKRDLLNYTGHLSVVNIFAIASQYIDKIATFQYVGPIALATYSFALLGPDRIRGWLKSVGGIIFPKLATRPLAEIDRVFYTRTLQAMLIGGFAAAIYSLAAPTFFGLFFPKYLESVRYSQVLSLTLIGTMAGVYIGSVITAHKIVPVIYIGSLSVHISRIVLFILFASLWGTWGVITAAVGVSFFNVAWHSFLWYWFVRRRLRMQS